MKNLLLYYNELKKQIADIEKYIETLELQKNMIREIANEDFQLKSSDMGFCLEASKVYIEKMQDVILSPVQYNALIISIYGCYENYIDNLCSEYILLLCKYAHKYEDLPVKVREKHVKKLGDFLVNEQRYRNYDLTASTAIENMYNAMKAKDIVSLGTNKKLILSHGGNLRFSQVVELLQDLGITEPKRKIVSNELLFMFHSEVNQLSREVYDRFCAKDIDKLFTILEELVEERNNIAHSWCISRKQYSEIRDETIVFIKCFARVLYEVMINSICQYAYSKGELKQLNRPIKVINNHILCINNGNNELKVGDIIFFCKK